MTEALTDAELQSLRNLGNESEAAADEIEHLRAGLIKAISQERERCARLAEKLTYRRRWLKAATNSTPDTVPPCEIAAAIRAGLDAPSPAGSETPAAGE